MEVGAMLLTFSLVFIILFFIYFIKLEVRVKEKKKVNNLRVFLWYRKIVTQSFILKAYYQ